MAYFSRKPYSSGLKIPVLSRSGKISLNKVKGVAAGLLLCLTLGFLLLWRPAYDRSQGLQKEKDYWQHVIKMGRNERKPIFQSMLLSLDQLPDAIEQCRDVFQQKGVKVGALNVERFGGHNDESLKVSFDYALVRLHLQGKWEGIISSLNTLESVPDRVIYVQEIALAAEGGEVLLRIYCYTGD
ncbi:hypothetical protein REC12_19450 [Desulfosporosinus sp. PR]|uniref:hypothetical protein n=1 Tax=Candidatus Desulfosporosinus nitrosoreducens TaxID=3401928 RepID=UPI0027EE759A|nr:hypothetical protein [Desulfosporosinus sp. PR]MDQ7095771.1 hypothetical protein [Desulfosporosinus sp. PR]